MVENGRTINRRRPFTKAVADTLTHVFVPDIRLDGQENLEIVRMLSKQGKIIIFTPNHESNADAPSVLHSLSRNGFGDIAENIVFMLGVKLKKNPLTRLFINGFNYIPVWPPSLKPKNAKEKQEKWEIQREAITSTKEVIKQGNHLVVFPEGGRSRTGILGRGNPGILNYIPYDSIIVPVTIIGTKEVLSPGEVIPKRFPVSVIFGQPVPLSELIDKNLSAESDRRRCAVDNIMKRIAVNVPVERRGVYS